MSHKKIDKIAYASLGGLAIGLIFFIHLSDEVWIISTFLAMILTIFMLIVYYDKLQLSNIMKNIIIYLTGLISIFAIRFLILVGAGLMISVPTTNFINGTKRNVVALDYHKYMEYKNNPQYYDGEKQLFVFYNFNEEISDQKHEELVNFLKEKGVFLHTAFVNIESKDGLELAKKFHIHKGHYIVMKNEDGTFDDVNMSGEKFLTNNKLIEFLSD